MAVCLLLFFIGFNALEATQPSLASRVAPDQLRGTALGVYNSAQALGLFAGGAGGGWIVKSFGSGTLFLVCACLMLLWLGVAWKMKTPIANPHP